LKVKHAKIANMIISFSGAPGSGKSTIAPKLANKLAWPCYYMGGLRREAARQKGLSLSEYNKLGETDIKTDQEVDEYQRILGQEQDNFVIEGRTSWYFIPHSLKIYLDVEAEVGAKRIFGSLQVKNTRNEDQNLTNWQAVFKSNKQRIASDKKRYQQYYQIDVYNHKNYDFVLDTTHLNQEQVFQMIYNFVQQALDKRKN